MDYLWTPWRSTYLSDNRDRSKCIFCLAAEWTDDAQTLVVYRAKLNFVILNRYPYTSGHLMIAPYRHASRMNQVDAETITEMILLARFAEKTLEAIYKPHGLNMGMNLGEAAGAGIEQHIHLHMLPRWLGDANFMTTVGDARVLPEALEDTYSRVKAGFADLTLAALT